MTSNVGCVRCHDNTKKCRFDGLPYAKWILKRNACVGVYQTLPCDIHEH